MSINNYSRRAFDRLVREYQSPVRRFFLNQTLGNEALSDDLAQDTFLKAYTHIGQFRGTSSFLTWLTRIAYNVWYDYCRKNRQTHPLAPPEREGSLNSLTSPPVREGSGVELGSEVGLDLYRALAILKEEERTCITLQLIDGYQIDQIADMTGMPAGTVKSHLSRGKDKLIKFLKANGYDR